MARRNNTANQSDTPDQNEDFDSTTKSYYKTMIPGLAVRIMENEDRDVTGTEKVRFVPYEFNDEKRGEKYRLGLLETDEPEAVEILDEDHNVTKIDAEEYAELVKTGKRVPY